MGHLSSPQSGQASFSTFNTKLLDYPSSKTKEKVKEPGYNGAGQIRTQFPISSIRVHNYFGGEIQTLCIRSCNRRRIPGRFPFRLEFFCSYFCCSLIAEFCFLVAMDDQKLEELKIQLQQLRDEARLFVQQIPPAQLYGAIGVVICTIFFFLISKLDSGS